MEFQGNTPYVLVVLTPGSHTAIDLDEPGWAQKYAHLMRAPGRWILARKNNQPVLVMTVKQGEQPYYTSRVLGTANLPPPDAVGLSQADMAEVKERAEVRAYGIGKKRLDGHVDRMWILPTGVVCAGNDVDELGSEMAKTRLFALLRSAKDGSDRRRHRQGQEGQGQQGQEHREEDGVRQEDGGGSG